MTKQKPTIETLQKIADEALDDCNAVDLNDPELLTRREKLLKALDALCDAEEEEIKAKQVKTNSGIRSK